MRYPPVVQFGDLRWRIDNYPADLDSLTHPDVARLPFHLQPVADITDLQEPCGPDRWPHPHQASASYWHDLAEALRRGDPTVPPLVLVEHAEERFILDGNHRASLALGVGRTRMPAYVAHAGPLSQRPRQPVCDVVLDALRAFGVIEHVPEPSAPRKGP